MVRELTEEMIEMEPDEEAPYVWRNSALVHELFMPFAREAELYRPGEVMAVCKAQGINDILKRETGAIISLTGSSYYGQEKMPTTSMHSILMNLWRCRWIKRYYRWVYYGSGRTFGGGWLFKW